MRNVNRIMGATGTAAVSVLAAASVSDMGCATLDAVKGGMDAAKGAADAVKGQVKGNMKAGTPDKDGDDNDRLHAIESEYNMPLDDKIDFKKGDKVDWRKFVLNGKPANATFELHWDEDKANLDLDVFNENGTLVAKSPPRLEGQSTKRIIMKIDKPGLFYVKVSGQEKADISIYTMSVRWEGAPAKGDKDKGGDQQAAADKGAAQPDQKGAAGDKGTAAGDKGAAAAQNDKGAAGQPPPGADKGQPPPPLPFAQDPTKVVGSIVTAFREGTVWNLQIDRGSGQKIKVGLKGNLLEGPEGDKLVDGGAFTINKILDGNKATATSYMKNPPGKNKRIVIYLAN